MNRVITGLEACIEDPAPIGDRPWALLSNQASVTTGLEPSRLALARSVPGGLTLLLAPEHGLDGVAQDMEAVADEHDWLTGLPVRSLYGSDATTLAPPPDDLDGVEVVVVDLLDVGTRHYTFAATMDAVMGVCAATGVEVVVLDRPNPLGGLRREGGLVQPGFESFVSQLPVPIRHGLTLGEIALLLQRQRHDHLELTVVPCRGWARGRLWEATGLPWVPPSPNMPTPETAALYPGLCLVEATTLSEGRGTTRPFHLVGAPWADGVAIADALVGHPGLLVRPARFRPAFGKHAGQVCSGVELTVGNGDLLEPVRLGLELLIAFRAYHPDRFAWRAEPYEFVSEVPAIDLLTGSAEARAVIESGSGLEELLARWRRQVEDFEAGLEGIELYR